MGAKTGLWWVVPFNHCDFSLCDVFCFPKSLDMGKRTISSNCPSSLRHQIVTFPLAYTEIGYGIYDAAICQGMVQ